MGESILVYLTTKLSSNWRHRTFYRRQQDCYIGPGPC